jgi:spore coat polysaccharide biosynthesis predicted glycosyltransferase SpsG
VRDILVSCGATDPVNATTVVLNALVELPADIAVTTVLSSKASHLDVVRRNLPPRARLIVDADNMAELMTTADLAIGASGTASYERAVLGLPSILITLADNQRGIAATMFGAGAAFDAGKPDATLGQRLRVLIERLLQDSALRVRMARAAAALVDGRGAARICEAVS